MTNEQSRELQQLSQLYEFFRILLKVDQADFLHLDDAQRSELLEYIEEREKAIRTQFLKPI